jgi:hypothetical protein
MSRMARTVRGPSLPSTRARVVAEFVEELLRPSVLFVLSRARGVEEDGVDRHGVGGEGVPDFIGVRASGSVSETVAAQEDHSSPGDPGAFHFGDFGARRRPRLTLLCGIPGGEGLDGVQKGVLFHGDPWATETFFRKRRLRHGPAASTGVSTRR